MKKKALITGVTGQDGSYLVEFLLKKNYQVHGIIRRSSQFNTSRVDHLINNSQLSNSLFFYPGDITDPLNIDDLIEKIKPDEIYNLAAQSHVRTSFDIPYYTANVDALGTLNILEVIRHKNKKIKFYQASTSELYGNSLDKKQNELTKFNPSSPYAISKLFSYHMVKLYRESYGIFGCNGILFNHESPRRGETFVTKKIITAAVNIKKGKQKILKLGNLNAFRDWGYAPEYVEAMWLMLQQKKPDDFVIATGKKTQVREFVKIAFKEVGIDIQWIGLKEKEKGINKQNKKTIISIDPKFYRPLDLESLLGNPSKAKKILKWKSQTNLKSLVKIMIKYELSKYKT